MADDYDVQFDGKLPVVFFLDSAGQGSGYNLKSVGGFGSMMDGGGYQGAYNGAVRDLQRVDEGYAMAYMTCVWAFRGIQIRAQKVGELLRDAKLVDVDTGKVIKRHLYLDALENAFINYYQDFYEEWYFFKALTGEAYIYLEDEKILDTDITFPYGVRVLNSLAVEPNILGNKIKDFWYNEDGGTPKDIPPSRMVFDKYRNPFDDLRGASLLTAAMDAVNIDRQIAILNKNFVRNNARPGLIFTPRSGKLGIPDGQLIKDFVAEDVKGAKNAGKPLVMPFPMDVTVAKPPDLEDQTYLTDDQKSRILSGLGIPLGMVDYGAERYQMSPEQRRGFYTETIIPDASHAAMVINARILRHFDPQRRFKLELDLTRIMPILEDQQVRTNITNIRYRSGLLSWNEARIAQGERPEPGKGDFYIMPEGYVIVKTEDLGNVDKAVVNAGAGLTVDGEGPITELGQMPQNQGGPQKVGGPENASAPGMGGNGQPKKKKGAGGDSSWGGSPSGLPALPKPQGLTFNPHFDTHAQNDFPFTKSVVDSWEKELQTWNRFAYRNGTKKAQRFQTSVIPQEVADAVKSAMIASVDTLKTKGDYQIFFESIANSMKAAAQPDNTNVLSPEGLQELAEIWEDMGLETLTEQITSYDLPEEGDQNGETEQSS